MPACVQGLGAMVRSLLQQVVGCFKALGLATPELDYAASVLADPKQQAPDRERRRLLCSAVLCSVA